MKTDRLFQIVYTLLDKKYVTAPELAELLSVSVRTIYRDVEVLSMAGIPIYCLTGKGGGIALMPGFSIDKALFSEEEWQQILFALQSMKVSGENVEKLLSKIGAVCGRLETNWIEVDFARWGHSKKDTVKFNTIKQAIIQKQIIKIRYYDAHGKQTSRNLKPFKLVFRNISWYIQGYCLLANDFRCFKLNRIVKIELKNEFFDDRFDQIPDMEIEDDSNVITLQVKIDAKEAYRVFDDFDEESIKKDTDDSVILTVRLPYDNWVFSYILSFGTHIEILEPIWLKEQIKKHIKKLYQFYET